MLDALDLVLARVQFYDQSGVSTLESGFREDHCSEGPGPGFGKWFGARLAAKWPVPTSAPQDGVSSGAIAGTTTLYIISTRSSGDLARELKEGPARGGVLLSSLQEAS